ncbi:Sodium/potassium-transporting ATPase subunit beta-1 [Taenia crassiceps]|uniref:Sodium/potassium-transporting ATPase subunit beta-1 n=1 Tax=Taenia crassiceps TaxID=6207 RepID=A0ABR4Q0A4_9CEST
MLLFLAKILIYYVIFYTCLFGILTGRQSLLGLNPGLTFLPVVDFKGKLHPYPAYDSNDKAIYAESMRHYVTGIRLLGDISDACQFPLRLLGPCKININSSRELCIYLKMNKIFGYLPDVSGSKIFVSCQATDELKRRELGLATFYPSASDRNKTVGYFSTVAFPYLNQAGYQSPLLAVTFPRIAKNVSITVGCRPHGCEGSTQTKDTFSFFAFFQSNAGVCFSSLDSPCVLELLCCLPGTRQLTGAWLHGLLKYTQAKYSSRALYPLTSALSPEDFIKIDQQFASNPNPTNRFVKFF